MPSLVETKSIFTPEEAAPYFYGDECLDKDGKVIENYVRRLRHACKLHRDGKDGIFNAGTPIGKTKDNGEVELFVDPNQLSFVTVNLIKPSKEVF